MRPVGVRWKAGIQEMDSILGPCTRRSVGFHAELHAGALPLFEAGSKCKTEEATQRRKALGTRVRWPGVGRWRSYDGCAIASRRSWGLRNVSYLN
jgi:hypothetical protein